LGGKGSFRVETSAGSVAGTRLGQGPPALVLHGGPGLSGEYTEPLALELADMFDTIRYQQRGQEPTTVGEPYTVEAHVDDATAVLDGLGVQRAWIIGHSWGGHLAMHLAASRADRLLGLIVVDPLGGLPDGGEKELEENLTKRLAPEVAERVNALDAELLAGRGGEAEMTEMMRLVWPFYFADPAAAPPMPPLRSSASVYAGTWESIRSHFAAGTLVSDLPRYRGPTLFIHGRESPIPPARSDESAQLIEGARLVVLSGVGHLPWLERPGSVAAAVREFLATSADERT
jgi:pimeloyl-ACP methyl ester carboxylesterase